MPGSAAPEAPPAVVRDQELWDLGRAAARAPGLLDHLRDPSRPAPRSLEMAEWFAALRAHLDREGYEDVQVIDLGGEPPARTDPDDPFVQMVVRTAREVYGVEQLINPMTGGSGPNHVFIESLHVPVATAGVGYPGSRAHAPNENLKIDNFVTGTKHTARIIEGMAGL